jgi:maleate cis-trans isomerase
LEKIAGVPVITAASAVREAIAALGLRSVAAATPYSDGSNKIVADFLTRSGLKDSTVRGLGFDTSPQVWREKATTVTPEEIQAFCASIDQPSADALYLPCTGVRSVEALAALEQQCNKPAFSSVQAGFWAALRRLGVNGRQDGFGRLISTWDYASA